MTRSRADDIERMMRDTGVETKRQLFDWAITMLIWAIRQRRQGLIIASIEKDDDGTARNVRELCMPVLEAARRTGT